ncbi:MAG: CheR family methyltransferase [Lysobacteraceae bacterium]
MAIAATSMGSGGAPQLGLDDVEFERWVRLVESRTGVIVPVERKPFLESGLRRRMRETGHSQFGSYYTDLLDGARGAVEWTSLVDLLTVHESHFFRHRPSLDLIREEWLPQRLAQIPADEALHALSVGCSTGEEAYTLAMLFDQTLSADRRFGITATDVSQGALSIAKTGEYPLRRLAEIPANYRSRATEEVPGGELFRIAERLRKRIGFACVNLLHATRAPLRKLDLIFCQNVLIYFARDRRSELLDGLAGLLHPGGLLVLGPGEVTGWNHPRMSRVGNRQTLAFVRNPNEGPA